MNEVLKAISERRSIRRFKAQPVSEADLEALLTAGLFAPSARNSQAVHLSAVVGPDHIAKLDAAVKAASVKPGFDKYAAMIGQGGYSINFKDAPLFIIVSADRQAAFCPPEDGALVLGNILLAAHALGLGACWINQLGPIGDEPEFRQTLTALGVPTTHQIVGCAAVGHPAGEPPQAPARKSGRVNIVR